MEIVTLSGADLGGTEVDGSGWEIGTEREFSGLLYRRISAGQAIYVGAAG
jgi:hypothetical protein